MTIKTRYIPVPEWPNYHPYPTIAGLRNFINKKDTNGFDKVVKRVGKRVLIDEAAFFEWIENQQKTNIS